MAGPAPTPVEELFWAKVHKAEGDGCWLWMGAKTQEGYGVFTYRLEAGIRTTIFAHRFSMFLKIRLPLPERHVVCHHCDNPGCVRPDHLFHGTVRENAIDAQQKGRLAFGSRNGTHTKPWRLLKGEQNPQSKVTEAMVLAIRAAAAQGTSGRALARQFGISPSQVSNILLGRQWRHV